MQKKSLRKSKPTLGMKIPPWNFSLRGAGLDPNSSRSWTDPPRPPQKGSMKPPRPPHGATKGIPARKKNTSWKQQKNQLEKTPNPLRSPLPRVKLKTKVGGREVPPAWTPPGGTWGRGKNPVLQVGTWERRYRGGVRGFRYQVGLCLTQMWVNFSFLGEE